MGESRAGAPGAEGVIIRGTCGVGLGAASFQDLPCESRTQKPSESLERCVCFSLDTEVAPMFMSPRLDQEKPCLGYLGPSPLPV